MADGKRILIIESDKKKREDLCTISKGIGIAPYKSRSWADAKKRLKDHYYDIIILGLKLPGISAIELIHEIRGLGLDSCLIVCAPYTETESIATCLKNGAYDIIPTPIHKDWTRIKITRALERRRYYNNAKEKDHYQKLSIFDDLTGIYNHRYFHGSLEEAIKTAKIHGHPLSLLMMDLDDFKEYNDRHGHLAGDEVLKSLGSLLSRCTREGDIVARYGGEEFSMILPDADKKSALLVAERLLSELECVDSFKSSRLQGEQLTISIGVATFPGDAQTKEALLKKADEALYNAKRAGKNRVCIC